MTSFGEYLKILREQVGISQEGLAQEANISSAYVSQIESGRRNVPTPDVLRRMAAPLDVPYLVLMRQAGHLHDSELQLLLLRTLKELFAQEPGRTILEELLRDSIDRWIELDAEMRHHVLNTSDLNHVGELIIDALLQRQADLILANLFSDDDAYFSNLRYDENALYVVDGFIDATEKPGLGVEPDMAVLGEPVLTFS